MEKLILRLEEENKINPRGFRLHVWCLIVLGYLTLHALWISCLLILAGVGGFLYVSWTSKHFEVLLLGKILLAAAFGALGTLLILVRLLFYQPKLPPGFEITPKDAPGLFKALEEVMARTGTRGFSRVYLNADFNALTVYLPSLMGLLPGETNLVVGVPLLAVLSVDETKAVLAHELGHLERGDGAFAAWVYRNRLLWLGLGLYMRRAGGILSGPTDAFFRWYSPRLNAYSLVGAREFEYRSDKLAVEAVGVSATARALAIVHTLSLCMKERFQPALVEQIKTAPVMPGDIFPNLMQSLQEIMERGDLNDYLAQAMIPHSDLFDSHPSLANRLAALGAETTFDLRGQDSSGLDLLRESWTVIQPLCEHVFNSQMREVWGKAHARHLKNTAILARINNKAKPTATWNHQEVLEYAVAARESAEFEHAWEWVNRYISLQPEEAVGYYLRAQMAAERHHDSCLDDFRKAATLSPKIAPLAYRQLLAFAERHAPHLDLGADRAALHSAEKDLESSYGL